MNNKFEYMLLGRLVSDCKYFLQTKNKKRLWAGNVEDQIKKMYEIWEDLEIKPKWISLQEIKNFEIEMLEGVKNE